MVRKDRPSGVEEHGTFIKGCPGTWEILPFPRKTAMGAAANASWPMDAAVLRAHRNEQASTAWYRGAEGGPERSGTTGRKSERPSGTDESGEPVPRDPEEGRGAPGHGTVGGNDAGAAGVDGQTAAEYEANLEGNLRSLLDRAKSGTYWAPPVRRAPGAPPRGLGELFMTMTIGEIKLDFPPEPCEHALEERGPA